MITTGQGNLLNAQVEALVNTVNCVGVMGRGIALQFKKAFPDNCKHYIQVCKNKKLFPGEMLVFDRGSFLNPRYIINFPTKNHWKEKSNLEFIRSGLSALTAEVKRLGIKSIAIPPLGCGNGGLNWSDVKPLIQGAFVNIPEVEVLLFEPSHLPKAQEMPVRTQKPKLTMVKAALLKLIALYKAVDSYWLTRLEIQKLAYFWHECGDGRDRLKFVKWYYGPYSEGLEHMMQDMDGHWIEGCGDNNKPFQVITLNPGAMTEVDAFLKEHTDANLTAQFERILKLVDGFESPSSIELLATTHYVATHNKRLATNVDEAVEIIYGWNTHKCQFTPHQISCAWERLEDQGWIMR